jgi:aminocarboxymuconate-semialdehyde decarboxylase
VSLLIDAHSHLYPDMFRAALRSRSEPPQLVPGNGVDRFVIFAGEEGRPFGSTFWSVDDKLAFMDEHAISISVVSLGNPWLDPFVGSEANELARSTNEFFASLEDATGGLLVGLASLPQHDVAAALDELDRIAASPGLRGVAGGCRLCGRELDDPDLNALWERLSAAKLPFFVHPHYTVGGKALKGFGNALQLACGFPFETTVAVAKLVFAGVLQRYPDLVVFAAHGGGTLPFLVGRLDTAWRVDAAARARLKRPPAEDLKRVFVDGLVYDGAPLRACVAMVGTDHVAFGTDHPFSVADPARNVAAIDQALLPDEQMNVRAATAKRVFRLDTQSGGDARS